MSGHSYDPSYFIPLAAAEDRHFWFRARNQVIATIARQLTAPLPDGYRVLEVGCGTGNVLRVLDRACSRGTVVGMDLFFEGLRYTRQRTGRPLVQGDMNRPPFRTPFDLIGIFDMLEHLPDDEQVLSDLHRMLAPGGVLFVTVPAHPFLWSYFDQISLHCRRYTLADLRAKLVRAGYEVEYITEYMVSIFPLVWLSRQVAMLSDRELTTAPDSHQRMYDRAVSELRILPVLNEVLTWLLAQETHLMIRRQTMSPGVSLLALARKR